MKNKKRFNISLIMLVFLLISCRVHKNKFILKSITVNFLSGNNYPEFSNVGNFKIIATEKDTLKKTSNSNYEFDSYSTLKKPLQVVVSKNKSFAILKANKKTFLLGELFDKDSTCNYNCNLAINPSYKITFKSYINFLPYWHGFSALGGLPLFMHYQTYHLKIKKTEGQVLNLKWKYSVYKQKLLGKKRREWSRDYCEDDGGGLVQLKIK